jgi:MFS family permease
MNFTVLTTTVIYATYAGGVLVALVLFGRWSDAIGRRPVLLGGVIFAVASAAVFLTADTVPDLVGGRVLSGLSAGIFTGTATAAVIEAVPPRWRSKAAAIATIANIGGLGAGPLLAGLLVQYAPDPLHLAFAVHIVAAVLAGLAVIIVPETSSKTGKIGMRGCDFPSTCATRSRSPRSRRSRDLQAWDCSPQWLPRSWQRSSASTITPRPG